MLRRILGIQDILYGYRPVRSIAVLNFNQKCQKKIYGDEKFYKKKPRLASKQKLKPNLNVQFFLVLKNL